METLLQVGLSNAIAAVALAGVAVLAALACRRPALLHGLWLLVLLKLVTPPLVPIPLSWTQEQAEPMPPTPSQNEPDASATGEIAPSLTLPARFEPPLLKLEALPAVVAVQGPAEEVPPPAPPAPPVRRWSWPVLVVGTWLAGTLGWFAIALVRLARFGRMLRHSRRPTKELAERVRRLAREVGLGKVPSICLLPGRIAPLVWAFGGWPRLVLPAELFERMTVEQQDTLLLHELAHLRRGDHLVRLLELVVRGLYWWHPVVWYAGRELREAEEQCCDAWVVSTLPGSGRTYAEALLETLDFLSQVRAAVPVLASGIGPISDLKRRLRMIMGGTTPRSLTWGSLLAMLVVGGFGLPLGPTLAQDRPTREKPAPEAKSEKPRSEDLDRARAEFKKLQDEMHRKRDEMHVLEKALAEVAARLQQAEGDKAEKRGMILRLEGLPPGVPGAVPGVGVGNGKMLFRIEGLPPMVGGPGVGGPGGKPREIILREVDGKWIIVSPNPGGNQIKLNERNFDIVPAPPNPPKPTPPADPARIVNPSIAPALPKNPNPNPQPQPRQGGDRIEKLEQRIRELEKLIRELKKPGATEPGKRSETPDLPWRKLGLRVDTRPADEVARTHPQLHGGLRVTEVLSGGSADKAGIRRGDILVGLHHWELLSWDNLLFVLNHSDLASFSPLRFYIVREGQIHRGWLEKIETAAPANPNQPETKAVGQVPPINPVQQWENLLREQKRPDLQRGILYDPATPALQK